MKTTTIELNENDYKKLKRKADKYEISVANYIMGLFREQTSKVEIGISLDDAIDEAFFSCDNICEIEDTLSEIESIAETKMEEAIEHLEKQEEL
jgi:hypothetical protein